MFTPQRKGWSPSLRIGEGSNPRSASGLVLGKGKGAVEAAAVPPPPQASLGANGGKGGGGGVSGGEVEVWRRFRDEGLLDESVLAKRDREALALRISELENELHDYQYNMGLLLIEKKEWSSRYEELRQRLLEAEEIIKREQTAHMIATSEAEKRDENLRKALGVEKQCVADLEKALREMRSEIAEVKFTSDKKMSDVHALEANIEEKYLEVERKLHSADAKVAEASRKSSEIDRKLDDVEARERKLQRDLLSLNTERKIHEKDIAEQREHLLDWEKKLQEGQKRLVDGQRFLNEREDRDNETDRALKKKEEEIEESRKMVEATMKSWRDKEDDVNIRLRALTSKEKDADVKLKNLENKEKDLLAKEEKLNAREREEIEKLLDGHRAVLDAKKQEFELEMEKKRKSFDDDMKSKLDSVAKEKKDVDCKEEYVMKREQELENKMEKLKNKEKDLDTKSKALKKWEDSIKNDTKKLEEEKNKINKESQELVGLKTELENLRAEVQAKEQQIVREKEDLKLTEEERQQHLKLQSELKQEIQEYRMMKESLVKESEALREEREKFEREWEVLDEKRMQLEAETKKAKDERDKFEKWRKNEQERLQNEGLQARADIQRELEDLMLKKEAFENTMEHERSEAREQVKRELADVARELELRKHDLEMNMQKKQEDVEKKLQEKENEFERRRESELSHITSSRNSIESETRRLRIEQDQLDRQKEELSILRNKLQADELDVKKDIDTLHMLSRNLQNQREEFIKKREQFLAAAEQCKTCHNCGVPINKLELVGLPSSTEIEVADVHLPSLAVGYIEENVKNKQPSLSPHVVGSKSANSGGRMSWLQQKCSRFFKLSPAKNVEQSPENQQFGDRLDMVASEDETGYGGGVRENNKSERLDKPADEPEPESSLGVADNSVDIAMVSDYDARERGGEHVIRSSNEINEMEESSLPPENDSQSQPSKQRRRQPSRRSKAKTVKRTRSVKAVVEDAKAILGENYDSKMDGEQNGNAKGSQNIDEESQGASVHAEPVASNARQKRRRPATSGMATSELEGEDSEAPSESVSMGGRRKRRQTSAPGMQIPGDKRYNLRRSTVASTVAAIQATSDQVKGTTAGNLQPLPETEKSHGDHVGEGTSKGEGHVSPSSGFVEENYKLKHMMQKATVSSVMEVHEVSSHKLGQCNMSELQVESDAIRSVELSLGSREDGDEVDGTAATNVAATPSDVSYRTDDEDGLEDEDDSEKHNASIGKKLWNFFTT